ncbi:MAG TPA: alpha/beta hydrolase [Ktedonobacterales bacterium]|nr:alpha/beta hydrolase [Ktedonobacterales bacterium]
MRKWLAAALGIACCLQPISLLGQTSQPSGWTQTIAEQYVILPDITYLTVDNNALKLDIYQPRKPASLVPVVIYFHGGGWVRRDKDEAVLRLLPYLQMGWAVVNVDYRLASAALAPAAVEDCRCALRWIVAHGVAYRLDTSKIVLVGASAGGHLALMAGIAPSSAGLDRECPGGDDIRVAAIVNWFGITDVADLLAGKNRRDYAVAWLGNQKDRKQIARRVSPLTYIRPGLPPIITVHADKDPTVPYSQAVRLHRALDRAGVPNQLITIRGEKHGHYAPEDDLIAYPAVQAFLAKHGVTSLAPATH